MWTKDARKFHDVTLTFCMEDRTRHFAIGINRMVISTELTDIEEVVSMVIREYPPSELQFVIIEFMEHVRACSSSGQIPTIDADGKVVDHLGKYQAIREQLTYLSKAKGTAYNIQLLRLAQESPCDLLCLGMELYSTSKDYRVLETLADLLTGIGRPAVPALRVALAGQHRNVFVDAIEGSELSDSVKAQLL